MTAKTVDRAGFVLLAALNAPASTTHLTASVIKDKVNVRSEADSQNGAIIDKARTGERLLVTDYGNKWTGIVLPDGKRGYIMTEYLQLIKKMKRARDSNRARALRFRAICLIKITD